jgi:hypothetical protein
MLPRFQLRQRAIAGLALSAALFTASIHAQTCPFDTGGSDAINDGVVLTRYALGITGAPLTASTRYASLDPLQVKANIECVGCALDVNQDGVVDTIDTTVIARHLAGFSGAAVTNGLGLTPAVAASVTSFLANGCAVGGAINAFVHGGNTFALGAGVASVLGNNDNRPLTLKAPQSTIKLLVDPANGDDGLRISYATFSGVASPNTINGSSDNSVAAGLTGATVAGGGRLSERNQVTGHYGTVGGGYGNVAGRNSVVAGGDYNQATGYRAVVSGGVNNVASGSTSTIPGGSSNRTVGQFSFAAGISAKANHDFAFVWGSEDFTETTSTGPKQFVISASGGIRLPGAGENQPGNAAKQSGTNMFTHVVPASGPCNNTGPFGLSRTAIDHPLTNGKADAILVVTPSFGALSAGAPGYTKPVVVFYDDTGSGFCPVGRWVISNPNGDQDMAAGMKFNVMVINP